MPGRYSPRRERRAALGAKHARRRQTGPTDVLHVGGCLIRGLIRGLLGCQAATRREGKGAQPWDQSNETGSQQDPASEAQSFA